MIWARERLSLTEVESNQNLLGQLFTDLGVNAVVGSTVTRIRLNWMVRAVMLTANDAVDSELAMGIVVLQQGGLAGLDPLADRHIDWMWWRSQPLFISSADAPALWGDVDIRSQRKLDEVQEDLVFSHAVGANVTNCRLDVGVSVLLKLP